MPKKGIMNMKFKYRAKMILASTLALVTLVGSPLAVYAGYAPSARPTYQCITPTNCPGADHVVFNSFTNAPNYGDERAFFDGKDATITAQGGYQDNINVHDGQRIVLRTYVHNNANPNAIGEAAATAHNTRMQVLLPTSKKTANTAASQIMADNASPGTVSDTVEFSGASPFTLAFDQSSPVQVSYRPNGTGDTVIKTLWSASFSNPQTLNANFGDWKGCFNYSALITAIVVVHMDQTPTPPAYSCDAFNITADVNRSVKITTFTTSNTKDIKFDHAVVDWGDGSNPLSDANVVGKTHQYAKDGTYKLTATAHFQLIANGQDLPATSANCVKQVTFTPDEPPKVTPPPSTPTTLVNTGPGQVAGIFAAVTAAGTLGYRRILSRKLSRQ
jgi:hypothetical protein